MCATLELTLDSGPQAASAARGALNELEPQVSPELLKDVRLMVSELVTNSIRHSGADEDTGAIGLKAWVGRDRLCVEVSDTGPGFEPALHPGRGDELGGWGLYIVETLTDRWGVRRDREASCVWFEIDLREASEQARGDRMRRAQASQAARGATKGQPRGLGGEPPPAEHRRDRERRVLSNLVVV